MQSERDHKLLNVRRDGDDSDDDDDDDRYCRSTKASRLYDQNLAGLTTPCLNKELQLVTKVLRKERETSFSYIDDDLDIQ